MDPIAEIFAETEQDESGIASSSDLSTRLNQVFPKFSAAEIRRMQSYGEIRHWPDGKLILEAGRSSPGMVLIQKGQIAVWRRDGLGNRALVREFGVGEFTGEVAQLTGRPPLVDGHAIDNVEALVFNPEALRALLIAEAEIGERIMRALILRRVALLQDNAGGPVLVGPPDNAALFELQSFLSSNAQPFTVMNPLTDAEGAALARMHNAGEDDWPLVVCPDGTVKKNPSIAEVGRCLGMLPDFDHEAVFDVIVVGAGPAGLAAAVYAASEGLSVLVLEQRSYGGQAGTSARIENYLGFPTGVSGPALAGRAYIQALKFGAEIAIPAPASRLLCDRFPLEVACLDGTGARARSVVLACGARYRKLALDNLAQFEGRGIYYWASPIEARLCKREEVIVVGGGNSAGQAAVFLARPATTVHVLIRGSGLAATMSSYLIARIKATSNIILHPHCEIAALGGDERGLAEVRVRNHVSGVDMRYDVRRVFVFVGAEPNTGWLGDCGVDVDDKGFIRTGDDLSSSQLGGTRRDPAEVTAAALETSVPGVFAIGDVRANSTKRVAAAVGEGAAVVAQLHAYLADLPD
ncbi:MAG: thioredoxin reductase [Massilia sp.]|nr:thioredoxin reductase [Massilia sp.]